MLAKLINGQLQRVPKTAEIEGVAISNYDMLDEAILKAHGWKDYIDTPMPEQEEGYYWVVGFDETDTDITKTWTKQAYPEPPEPEISDIDVIMLAIAEIADRAGISLDDMPEPIRDRLEARIDEARITTALEAPVIGGKIKP